MPGCVPWKHRFNNATKFTRIYNLCDWFLWPKKDSIGVFIWKIASAYMLYFIVASFLPNTRGTLLNLLCIQQIREKCCQLKENSEKIQGNFFQDVCKNHVNWRTSTVNLIFYSKQTNFNSNIRKSKLFPRGRGKKVC